MPDMSTAAHDDLEGNVDQYRRGIISGWAWRPSQPELAVVVQVLVDGRVVSAQLADQPRADLATAQKRGGACAFALTLDPGTLGTIPVTVTVREADGPTLPGGEFILDPAALPDDDAAGAEEAPPRAAPAEFAGSADYIGFLDEFGPDWIRGWIFRPAHPSPPVRIELCEHGLPINTVLADVWRTDLEHVRQGDGRWGFAAPVPECLRDGKLHVIELYAADGGPKLLKTPLYVRLAPAAAIAWTEPAAAAQPDDDGQSVLLRRQGRDAPVDVMFSIIVNFYNMHREAARTLTSLSRAYQRDIDGLRYEVLCIDNGSSPPLEQNWVESFGQEFRLITPSRLLPSPCLAINEAARQAKGRYVSIMIDGAHILTPGVLRETWDALEEAPGAVVCLRQWFVGGDQRWLSLSGYTREQEDILFDRVKWPRDGYKLFRIGSPIWESPNHWLDGMIESNCLFVPRQVYEEIGGIDEKFSEPGAGYANLDLFRRAVAASGEPPVALLGEASFHQFHDGTTTNVSDAEKEARVRSYENTYMRIRGSSYRGVEPLDIRVRGQLRSRAAVVGRQRPLSPARLGITDQIRPGLRSVHFDGQAAYNLQSVYVECGLHRTTRWLGRAVSLAPADILAIQEIIHEIRPERVVTVNVEQGVVTLIESLFQIIGLVSARIVRVDAAAPPDVSQSRAVRGVIGEPCAPSTLDAVARALDAEERVLVIFAPRPDDHMPLESLRAYARFVSARSYLIFLGTVLGQPWLGYSKYWFQNAVRSFTLEAPFVVDHSRTRHFVTTCSYGFLQRVEQGSERVDDEEMADRP